MDAQRVVIEHTIDSQLSREPVAGLPAIKLKHSRDVLYSGSSNFTEFEAFVDDVTRLFYAARLTGPSHNTDRILSLGGYLDGKALAWYNTRLKILDHPSFRDVIIDMMYNFVDVKSTRDADREYETLAHAPNEGGLGNIKGNRDGISTHKWTDVQQD